MNTFLKKAFLKLRRHYQVFLINRRIKKHNKALPEGVPVSEESPRMKKIIAKVSVEYKWD